MPDLRSKHLWITDPHLLPWNRYKLLGSILDEKPAAVFATGDLSYGLTLLSDLEFIGKRIGRPFYFVLGNHDYHGTSIKEVHRKIRELCKKYKNLVWMTDAGVVALTDEVAVIGTEGWYDVRVGNPQFINYTFDWFLTSEFKTLKTMAERIEKFRDLANDSAELLTVNLEKAIETYKTVYLLTHFPPWPEANRSHSFVSEVFWEPYNTNFKLGKELEKVMEKNKKRNLIVLCGHTHSAMQIHVSRNIECRVGRGAYHKLSDEEIIYI